MLETGPQATQLTTLPIRCIDQITVVVARFAFILELVQDGATKETLASLARLHRVVMTI